MAIRRGLSDAYHSPLSTLRYVGGRVQRVVGNAALAQIGLDVMVDGCMRVSSTQPRRVL